MIESLHDQLLEQARHLARRERRKPKQASLRRSISASYYALFHFLCDRGARDLLGSGRQHRSFTDAMARAFDHGSMREASNRFVKGRQSLPKCLQPCVSMKVMPPALVWIAGSFVSLQDDRHKADYDRSARLVRRDALEAVHLAESSMTSWRHVQGTPEARAYLISLLAWRNLASK